MQIAANKYLALFHLSIVQGIKNYKSLIGLSIFLVMCLIIFSHLWKIAAARAGATFLVADQLLWYIAFNEWVLIAIPDIQYDIEHDLRSGRLAYLLPRPISYLGAKLSEGLGFLLLNLTVLGFVAFSFTWLWVGHLPFPFWTFCIVLLIGILSGLTALIFQILIGLSAFWVHEVAPFNWLWEKLLFVLGGLILPLSVYPIWMQNIAFWTPFPAILGARSALAFNFNSDQILTVIASLGVWCLIGWMLLSFVYRKGLRIVNIEGG